MQDANSVHVKTSLINHQDRRQTYTIPGRDGVSPSRVTPHPFPPSFCRVALMPLMLSMPI